MVELANYIAEGAMAFLKAEWKVLTVFRSRCGAILAWSGTLIETSSPVIAVSFIIGAVFSATAGYFGNEHRDKGECANDAGGENQLLKGRLK